MGYQRKVQKIKPLNQQLIWQYKRKANPKITETQKGQIERKQHTHGEKENLPRKIEICRDGLRKATIV